MFYNYVHVLVNPLPEYNVGYADPTDISVNLLRCCKKNTIIRTQRRISVKPRYCLVDLPF